jgi:hypothetical protein
MKVQSVVYQLISSTLIHAVRRIYAAKRGAETAPKDGKEHDRAAAFLSIFEAERYLLLAFHDATQPPGKPYEIPSNPRPQGPSDIERPRSCELGREVCYSRWHREVQQSRGSHPAGNSMQVVSLTNQGPVLVPRQMKGDASSTLV